MHGDIKRKHSIGWLKPNQYPLKTLAGLPRCLFTVGCESRSQLRRYHKGLPLPCGSDGLGWAGVQQDRACHFSPPAQDFL